MGIRKLLSLEGGLDKFDRDGVKSFNASKGINNDSVFCTFVR